MPSCAAFILIVIILGCSATSFFFSANVRSTECRRTFPADTHDGEKNGLPNQSKFWHFSQSLYSNCDFNTPLRPTPPPTTPLHCFLIQRDPSGPDGSPGTALSGCRSCPNRRWGGRECVPRTTGGWGLLLSSGGVWPERGSAGPRQDAASCGRCAAPVQQGRRVKTKTFSTSAHILRLDESAYFSVDVRSEVNHFLHQREETVNWSQVEAVLTCMKQKRRRLEPTPCQQRPPCRRQRASTQSHRCSCRRPLPCAGAPACSSVWWRWSSTGYRGDRRCEEACRRCCPPAWGRSRTRGDWSRRSAGLLSLLSGEESVGEAKHLCYTIDQDQSK